MLLSLHHAVLLAASLALTAMRLAGASEYDMRDMPSPAALLQSEGWQSSPMPASHVEDERVGNFAAAAAFEEHATTSSPQAEHQAVVLVKHALQTARDASRDVPAGDTSTAITSIDVHTQHLAKQFANILASIIADDAARLTDDVLAQGTAYDVTALLRAFMHFQRHTCQPPDGVGVLQCAYDDGMPTQEHADAVLALTLRSVIDAVVEHDRHHEDTLQRSFLPGYMAHASERQMHALHRALAAKADENVVEQGDAKVGVPLAQLPVDQGENVAADPDSYQRRSIEPGKVHVHLHGQTVAPRMVKRSNGHIDQRPITIMVKVDESDRDGEGGEDDGEDDCDSIDDDVEDDNDDVVDDDCDCSNVDDEVDDDNENDDDCDGSDDDDDGDDTCTLNITIDAPVKRSPVPTHFLMPSTSRRSTASNVDLIKRDEQAGSLHDPRNKGLFGLPRRR